LPHGFGFWPANWTLGTNINSQPWPRCGEMDIMENKGSNYFNVGGTIHYNTSGNPGGDVFQSTNYSVPGAVTNFHTYAVQWTTNSINWLVDNVSVQLWTNWTSSLGPFPAPFDRPQFLLMNLAIGGNFLTDGGDSGTDTNFINAHTTFPGEMQIDYVRVYDDVPPLQATGVSPSNGCPAGGTSITITGTNFSSGASVTVGGLPATSVVFVNSNTLTAVTPANSSGAQNVAVSAPYVSPTGTNVLTSTLTNAFTYSGPPSFGGLTSATAGAGAATLTWSAASGVAPITYKVYEATASGAENFASPLLTTNGLSVFITPLDPGSNCTNTYFFVVRAVNGCGTSDGNSVEFSIQPTAPPPTFAGLASVTAAINGATLSWSTASGGTPPYTYNVFQATASGTENFASPLLTTNDLSVSVPLYPGSNSPITYFFVVRAQGGCGGESNLVEHSIQPLLDPNGDQTGNGIPNGWNQQYGFSPFDPTVAAADADGDGMSNLQEFLTGTDPTNSASYFHLISITSQGDDILITWMCGGGRTNVVQAAYDLINGYSNVSSNIVLSGSGDSVTNYLDTGAATNSPYFYRIQLIP